LRIKIGDAQGKNWWCVLFPPMCLGSSTVEKYDNCDELGKIGFSENEINIISENNSTKKKVRFFFLDLFGSWK
jgi:stage II sporulation protein R